MSKVSARMWPMAFRRLTVGIIFLAIILPPLFISQAFCFERPKDFRGLKWGTEISQIDGLVPAPALDQSESKRYKRPSDSLEVAGGTVDIIDYYFLNNRLTKVVIGSKRNDQFFKMKSVFFDLYGPPDNTKEEKQSISFETEYHWYARSDDEANVSLKKTVMLAGNNRVEMIFATMEWKGSIKSKSGL